MAHWGVVREREGGSGNFSEQFSYEADSDYKQFDEHWKSGIDTAIADFKPRT